MTLRHRTERKNVGRVMANEDEVVSVLRRGNLVHLKVVDFAQMSFTEQITVRSTAMCRLFVSFVNLCGGYFVTVCIVHCIVTWAVCSCG